MFPVYIYDEPDKEFPKEGTFFVVSGNGLWMHKDTGVVSGFVPVDNISCLEDLDAEVMVSCNLPPIPERIVWRIKEFFRRVVEKYDSEAATILYFNKEQQEYKVHIPEQNVSKGGVQYKRVALTGVEGMEDFLRVGTIHSHCDFDAFHSGTDISDEEHFDGLHLTFGHNDRDHFTISSSIVVNGQRLKVNPRDNLEGIILSPEEEQISREQFYCFRELEESVKEEWSEGLDQWMEQVKGYARRRVWGPDPDTIRKGDMVEWAGNLATVSFKETCGEGPFEVFKAEDSKITIKANFGLARFSDKLFRKVT